MKLKFASIILSTTLINNVSPFSPLNHYHHHHLHHPSRKLHDGNVPQLHSTSDGGGTSNDSSSGGSESTTSSNTSNTSSRTFSKETSEEALTRELREKSTFVDAKAEIAYGGGSGIVDNTLLEEDDKIETNGKEEGGEEKVEEETTDQEDDERDDHVEVTNTVESSNETLDVEKLIDGVKEDVEEEKEKEMANDDDTLTVVPPSPPVATGGYVVSTMTAQQTQQEEGFSRTVLSSPPEPVVVAEAKVEEESEEEKEEQTVEELVVEDKKEQLVKEEDETPVVEAVKEASVEKETVQVESSTVVEEETKEEEKSKTIDDEISALVDEVNKLTNEASEEMKREKSNLKSLMKEKTYEKDVPKIEETTTEKDTLVESVKEESAPAVINESEDSAEPVEEPVVKEAVEEEPLPLTSISEERLERILKPRAYPLFLAEKAALLSADFAKSIQGSKNRFKDESPYEVYRQKVYGVKKERIVILGTGWGSAAFLKDIDTNMYDVTVISPRNYFLFTPMLAGASVGTVDYRSITESVREINRRVKYLEGTAMDIDPETKTILCESVVCEGNSCTIEDFSVTYDKLIVTVGAQTNTYGIPGVREYCCFLKQVEDAKRVRTAIVNCFERANLPNLDEEAKKNILTFAVIGAGPTGVEFASELRDFIEQDGPKYYPDLLKYVRIKVIEASPTVLAPFDKSLQEEAIKQLTRVVQPSDPDTRALLPDKFKLTELLLNSGVSEVKVDKISLNDGTEIPYGLAIWAAGNGPLPITLQLIDALGKDGFQDEAQSTARGRLAVDAWLRVLDGDGSIYSFGDCSCITTGQLPATAQVASQQGEYLARLFSLGVDMYPGVDTEDNSMIPPIYDKTKDKQLAEKISSFAINEGDIVAPFQFLNLGILAYTGGGSALAQLQLTPAEQARVKGRGKIGFGLWRSVYLSKQVSWRNRCLVTLDWLKTRVFGRDITTFD